MCVRIFIYLCDNNIDKMKEMMNSDFLVSGNFGLFIAVTILRMVAQSAEYNFGFGTRRFGSFV